MPTIIIPAYNEAEVIGRTLSGLVNQPCRGPLQIVVSCNGCNDRTADVAREFRGVEVLETKAAGKPIALNAGDEHARSFPRIYLDADIEVSDNFVRELEQSLDADKCRAAWPGVRFDTSDSSTSVKAFYRLWTALPYNRPGRIGVGAYALNETARSRFTAFPSIIADDGYVRGLYRGEERVVVDSCYTVVKAPKTLDALIAIKTRSRMGRIELEQRHPELVSNHFEGSSAPRAALMFALTRPQYWPAIPSYLYVNLRTRQRARQKLRDRDFHWERDQTSRE